MTGVKRFVGAAAGAGCCFLAGYVCVRWHLPSPLNPVLFGVVAATTSEVTRCLRSRRSH